MNGNDITDKVLSNVALSDDDTQLEEGASDEEIEIAKFCNAWLDVIGLAVTGHLLEKIMRIPQLKLKGCDHVAADLNYLINVFSALGVAGHPHPLVSHLATLVTLSDQELNDQIKSRDSSDGIDTALKTIETRILLIRGISIG
jgi:hypothetical protein